MEGQLDQNGLGGGSYDVGGPVLSIRQIGTILWAHRLTMTLVPLLFAVVGALVLKFLLPRVYEATATLLVAFKADDPVSGGNFAGLESFSFMGTQVEMLQSASTLLPVVDKLRLIERKDYVAGYSGNGSSESVRQYVVTQLRNRLTITTGQQSRFLYVSADDEDPVKAATIANAVADTYLDEQMRQFIAPAKDRIQRYGGQLDTLRKNVEAAQAKVSAFRQKTGLIELTQKTDSDDKRLADFESRLIQASAARQDAELRLGRTDKGDAAVLNSTLVQNLKSQLQLKEAQLSELRGSLGPRHPQIVSLQGEMAQLNAQLSREIGVHVDSARRELDSARSVEEKLKREVAEERAKVMSTRTMQDESSNLLQELESATKVYQGALDSFEQAQLGTQMAASTVSIVNRAVPPSLPKGGRKKKFMLVVAFGFVLAAVGSFVYEMLNRRIRCREDAENDLGIPVLVELRAPA